MKYNTELLDFFKQNPDTTYKQKELAKHLKIPKSEYVRFKQQIRNLINEGHIFKYRKGKIGVGRKSKELIGKIDVKPQGYGFLVQDNRVDDIFISHMNMGTALNGDVVKVLQFAESKGHHREGRVIEIIQRARKNIIGIYRKKKHFGYVVPDDTKLNRDIIVPFENSKQAENGQKVVVRMIDWEDEHLEPEGEIVEILGYPDQPGVDIISVAKSFDLPIMFSSKVIKESEQFSENMLNAEIARRVDLRDELIFTIDPVDAKDFDDAVSLKFLENGNYYLGVHIADVSFFVRENTQLNKEAMQRGTSIYLVDRVIPMLPENLSNDLCSLKPKQDRLAMSIMMELTSTGEIVKYNIFESVINSKMRFSYDDVQQIIDGTKRPVRFAKTIQNMHKLSKILIDEREKRGGLNFDSKEIKIELDDSGKPVQIHLKNRLDSHRLIEEFMVLANETVATHVFKNLRSEADEKFPFAYRIHEKPNADKIKEFKKFLKALGANFTFKKNLMPKHFQQIIEEFRGTNKENLVGQVMVRSLMKAKYDTNNIGHFGLALKNYCHFTSPIRRYPDLICHRLLKSYFSVPIKNQIKNKHLKKICEIATEREIVALEAERASIKIKQLEFIEKYIGHEFEGIITGVVAFGIFVEISKFLIEGLIHITNLPDDYYIHDEVRYTLFGQHTDKTYQLGDQLKVRVINVNRDSKIVDFELASFEKI